jgi:hypothetical protein
MPDEHKKTDSSKRASEFTGKAVRDPAKPQTLVKLTGYRGESSEADHTRLYLDANISRYADIPEDDVLYELSVPVEADPLGAVTLWVKGDSNIKYRTSSLSSSGDPTMYTQTMNPPGAAAQSLRRKRLHSPRHHCVRIQARFRYFVRHTACFCSCARAHFRNSARRARIVRVRFHCAL